LEGANSFHYCYSSQCDILTAAWRVHAAGPKGERLKKSSVWCVAVKLKLAVCHLTHSALWLAMCHCTLWLLAAINTCTHARAYRHMYLIRNFINHGLEASWFGKNWQLHTARSGYIIKNQIGAGFFLIADTLVVYIAAALQHQETRVPD
jgi:hypothetical protein